MKDNPPVLILGIGNIILRDEGVGVRVIEAMKDLQLPEGVEIADGGTSGADLIDVIADRRKIVVVDAMQADVAPGTIMRFTADDLIEQLGPTISLHQFGLIDSLLMARQLNCPPREVIIFGVKPVDVSTGLELSPQVASLVPKLIELAVAEAAATP